MAFAEDLAEIRAALKLPAVVEALGESSSKVSTALHNMNSEYQDKDAHVGSNLGEIMKKKEKIRTLEAELAEANDKVTDLTGKADTTKLDAELTDLRGFKKSVIDEQIGSFEGKFAKIVDHANFDKVKPLLTLPAVGDDGKLILKDGKYDFTGASPEAMAANAQELKKLDALDYFGTPEKQNKNTGHSDQRRNKPPPNLSEKYKGVKTVKEAQAMQDD